jgi:peptidoglycan/xylan/chitin deacetylase (PgdA/CDA1 family)
MNLFKLHSRFGVPIVMFHGLCEQLPEYTVFLGGRTCILEVNDFAKFIEWIARNFQVIRIEDLDKNLTWKYWSRPPIVLTFDDGLASIVDLAVPILQEYNISAVVFVTIDWIDSGRTPDIFLLERAVWESVPGNLFIRLDDKRFELQISSRRELSMAFKRLWDFLFEIRFPPLNLAAENVLINGKTWERKKTLEDRYFWFPASWQELRTAAQAGVIEIGSHMVSHTPLTFLSDEEKLFQLEHSRDQLSNVIGVPVTACSYPHGLIDKRTISLSEKIYKWGFTNRPGRVQNNTCCCVAPRYHVPGEAPEYIVSTLRWGQTISRVKRFIFSKIKT